jgi:hypothetical protein
MTKRYQFFRWGLRNKNVGSTLAEAMLNNHRNAGRSVAGRGKGVAIGLVVSCALLMLFALPLAAQNADVSGIVRDNTGSVVPNAALKLTNEATGVVRTVPTDGRGLYAFPAVQPGVYDLGISASGFQSQNKTGITINVADNIEVNFDLKVGGVNETVTVTADQLSIDTADAVTGQMIDREYLNDMPLINRSPLDLAYLAPGVSQPPGTTYGNASVPTNPYLTSNNFVSDGSRNATSEVLIDGITANEMVSGGLDQFTAYTPSVDAIQEFKVEQTNFSAEYGFTGATVTNLITRSGTNKFHGSLFEFLRNDKLDANNYFADQAHIPLPGLHENIFGGTFGGPVFKNRTFFFFDYEGTREHQLSSTLMGVPSTAEKGGDFSELCGGDGPHGPAPGATFINGQCSNAAGQIWDPYTGVYSASAGGPVRSNFIPNNNIAAYTSPGNPKLDGTVYQLAPGAGNTIDPVASKLMALYPKPNYGVDSNGNPGPNYNPYYNYFSNGTTKTNNDQWDLKIDQHFSDRDMLSGRYSYRKTTLETPYCFPGDKGDPCTQGPEKSTAHLFSLNYNHVFSGRTMLSFTYGLTRTARFLHTIAGDFPGMDPVADLGMPGYIDSESGTTDKVHQYPSIYISDTYGTVGGGSIGSAAWSYLKDGQTTHDVLATLSRLQGRHELKVGGEFRFHQFGNGQPGTPAGLYNYGYQGTSQYPWWGGGDAMASFLMATSVGGWGQYEIPAFMFTQNAAWAGFAQDNFHVSPKLTINAGLRYDLTMPATERNNELNWLDPKAASPLQAPAGYPALTGAVEFASSQHKSNYDTNFKNFQPRVGLAYSLDDKTVVRAGYGIYFDTPAASANADVINVQGYDQKTNWQSSDYDGATPWGMLRNPFPGTGGSASGTSILPVTGNKLGALTDVGSSALGPVKKMNSTPYEQSWSFGVQRTLPWNMLAEANYVGKQGTHLYFGIAGDYNMNHLPESVVGSTPDQIADMLTYVPNPYASAIASVNPNSDLASPTIQAYKLQVPYPEFDAFEYLNVPWANSNYNALQLSAQKRMSNGLQFLVTYVWSKSMDEASEAGNGGSFLGGSSSNILDPNRLKLERSLSQFNIPQTFQFSYVYKLPFGHGQQFGANANPIVNAFLGGWQTNGIWRFDNGQPIMLGLSGGQALPTFGQRPYLTGSPKRNHNSGWLNQYFTDESIFQVPTPYTLGNAPRTLKVNTPGTANATLSMFKQFNLDPVREGSYLEFRLESFNALNHPQFCGPNATVGSGSSFGTVTCQANLPRQVQIAGKLYF